MDRNIENPKSFGLLWRDTWGASKGSYCIGENTSGMSRFAVATGIFKKLKRQ